MTSFMELAKHKTHYERNKQMLNWQELRVKQNELDEPIIAKAGVTHEQVIRERVLALLVELGELANELPETFKYWSYKNNDYEKALVEYVDNLHFILSIENYYEFSYSGTGAIKQIDLTEQFLTLFQSISTLDIQMTEKHNELIVLRGLFLGLGEMIGFTTQNINEAYNVKYEINIQRQLNNY